ncbi:MAG TPA: hypothetical protein VMH22_02795 [bacterium]|nr:hypothetical protein [bacterium]
MIEVSRHSRNLLMFALSLLLVGMARADSLGVRLVGHCDTPGSASDVAVAGSYAYVADWNSGLRVITVADPAHPAEVGSVDTPSQAGWVAASGSYAYVAALSSGLHVISVSNPASPTEVGHCQTHGAFGVAVSGSYAYVGDSSGLRVISISDPAHPAEAGYCATTGSAEDVAVQGNYAYVVDTFGLRVMSISDPAHPVEVGQLFMPDYPYGVAVSGDYAYVADNGAGLRVVSVVDPAHPTEVGHLNTPGVIKIVLDGGNAYCTGGPTLGVVSVADPAHPSQVGYYNTQGQAFGAAASGGYIYVADDTRGLQICQYYGGGVEETPNAEVRAVLSEPTVVRGVLMMGQQLTANVLRPELLDASGRNVAVLHAGANDVSRLAPGVYFVREAQAQAVRKVVVTR